MLKMVLMGRARSLWVLRVEVVCGLIECLGIVYRLIDVREIALGYVLLIVVGRTVHYCMRSLAKIYDCPHAY